MDATRARRLSVRAALVATVVAAGLAVGVQPAAAQNCSGNMTANGFTFSCDTALGPNSSNTLFDVAFSTSVTSATIVSPAGISCATGNNTRTQRRIICTGSSVPAGTAVVALISLSGSTTCAQTANGGPLVDVYGGDDPYSVGQPLNIDEFQLSACSSGTGGTGTGSTGGTAPTTTATCVVPKLHGKTLAVARTSLTKSHCALGRITHRRAAGRAGVVVSQSPKPGTKLRAGSKVAIVISRH
ncbi:MAG: PASTA domain-containing protein [Solirubrobacteraceae bacterium]